MIKRYPKTGLIFEQLEPRVLMSGDGVLLPIDAGMIPVDSWPIVPGLWTDAAVVVSPPPAMESVSQSPQELIFVDQNIDGLAPLLDSLATNQDGRQLITVVLDGARDGIEQITEVLRQYQGIAAVHVFSHGGDGVVRLGSGQLTAETIERQAESLASWAGALTGGADILFYGCNLAAGEEGRSLLEAVRTLTGADVAASTNPTGSTKLGGDWILEYVAGTVETAVAVDDGIRASWTYLLPVVNISGTVYADEGVTSIGANASVQFLVNGVSVGSTLTNASGSFSLNVNTSAGDAMALYLDNDPTYQGATVTVAKGAALSNINIYANHLIVRHDNGGTITNADLAAAKGAAVDPDILYSVSGNDLTVTGAGIELYLPNSHKYSPGGNVTTPALESVETFNGGSYAIDINGNLTISGGTFTASSGIMTVRGNIVKTGTFNHNNGTVVLDGTSQSLLANDISFYNLTKTVTVADTLLFQAGKRYTINAGGTLTLQGAPGQFLRLDSTDGATKWEVDLKNGAATAIKYVDLHRSEASPSDAGEKPAVAYNSVDSGNNKDWFIVPIGGYDFDAAFWSENTNKPKQSDWDGAAFAGKQDTVTLTDRWRIVQGADAPTRGEKIVVGIEPGGSITGMIGDGPVWNGLPLNPLGTVTNPARWGVAVAYEQQSGDAVLVWNDSTRPAGQMLRYSLWDGENWTAPALIANTVYPGAEPQQIRLVANPLTDEMVLVVSDSNADDYVLVWDCAAWGHALTLDTTGIAATEQTSLTVVYEEQSGDALVFYGKNSTNFLYYRVWDGSSWGAETVAFATGGGAPLWIDVAGAPTSDRIAVGVINTAGAVVLSIWDGAGFVDTVGWGSLAPGTTFPGLAMAFEAQSGEALAVCSEPGPSNLVKSATWVAGSGWIAGLSINVGAVPTSVFLDPNPDGNGIMLSVLDMSNDINYALWNGTSWGAVTELNNGTAETVTQPHIFLWNQTTSLAGGFQVDNEIPAAQISQAADGSGTVTVSWKGRDPQADAVTLFDFQYSDNGGTSWYTPVGASALSAGWADPGSGWSTATSFAAATTHSFTFFAKSSDLAPGHLLGAVDNSTVQVRFRLNDGSSPSEYVTSESFQVDTLAPITTFTSADYNASTDTLTIIGTNFTTIAAAGTDIKGYVDWSHLLWDVNDDGGTTPDLSFVLANVGSLIIIDNTTLVLEFTAATAASIEATAGVGAAGGADTLDIAADFSRDAFGNAATAGGLVGGILTVTDLGSANNPPTISGAVGNQTVNDTAVVSPFQTVTIDDPDSLSLDVAVALDDAAKGVLTNLDGFVETGPGTGVYVFSGTPAAATTAIQGLIFEPANNRAAPNDTETTTFTIIVDDTIAAPATDNATTVITTSMNDAPAISGTVAGQAVNDTGTLLPFGTVTITDPDPADLQVTVALDDGAKGNLSNLGGFVNLGGGIYSYTGTATAATNAIRGLVFSPVDNRVVPGGVETTTFSITVDDAFAGPVVDNTTSVDATSVNDAPTATNLAQTQTYLEDAPSVPLDDIVVTDVDFGATITVILTLAAPGAGSLSAASGNGESYTDATGIWSISATVAQVNAALAALVFVPATHYDADTSIITHIEDQDGAGPADGVIALDVTPVNDVPVALANTVTTAEDIAYTFGAGDFIFTDVEANGLVSVTITNQNLAGGTLELSGVAVTDGDTILAADIANLVYTPAANASGAPLASFEFTVNDVDLGTVAAQLDIEVTAVNDVPMALENTVTTAEDIAYTFVAGDFTFTDVEANGLVSVTINNQSLAGGTLKLSGVAATDGDTILAADIANLVYTPAANASGAPLASFEFTVNDAGLGTVAAQLAIDVTPSNDIPMATNLSTAERYVEDTPLNLTDIVITDADSATVTASLRLSAPAAGSLSTSVVGTTASVYDAASGTWTASGPIGAVNGLLAAIVFTPSANYYGPFTISVRIDDGIALVTDSKPVVGIGIGDTPMVASITTAENTLSGPIVIDRHPADGSEVAYFKISGITNGTLFQADGLTPIPGGTFITFAQAQAGVRFLPTPGSVAAGSFNVESSEDGITVAAQSGVATAAISVTPRSDLRIDILQTPPLPDIMEQVEPPATAEKEAAESGDADKGENTLQQLLRNFVLATGNGQDRMARAKAGAEDKSALGSQSSLGANSATESFARIVGRNQGGSQFYGGSDTSGLLPANAVLGDTEYFFEPMTVAQYELIRKSLDSMKEESTAEAKLERTVVGSAIAVSTGLSVGYVIWLVRGGMLLSSLLSSMPAWQIADPLPILAGRRDEEEDEESLETILADGTKQDEPEAPTLTSEQDRS